MSEKRGNFFQNMRTIKSRNMRQKYAEVVYSRKSDMVRFWGPQPLFSTFKIIAKLESTCRPNWWKLYWRNVFDSVNKCCVWLWCVVVCTSQTFGDRKITTTNI